MSHRVTALYHDRQLARLAAEDLCATGFPSQAVEVADGVAEGSGRIEVRALDWDQALDVKAFLEQDGSHSVEIRAGVEQAPGVAVPPVPAEP